jgi:Rrf2 family protein
MLKAATQDAIRALDYIASHPDRNHTAASLARELDRPIAFLAKSLQKLVRAGLLHSSRGPKGGVQLARPAETITLLEAIESIESEAFLGGCVLGLTHCGGEQPCPLHAQWSEHKSALLSMLATTALSELSKADVLK